MAYGSVVRTLVIDGVTNSENPKDGGKDRSSRRVLSVEIPGLQSSEARLRGWSLGEFRVEVDEWSEASSGSSGLYRRTRKHALSGVAEPPSGEFWQRTRRVGEATFGGTIPPSWRRTREECIIISESMWRMLLAAVRVLAGRSPCGCCRPHKQHQTIAVAALNYLRAPGES